MGLLAVLPPQRAMALIAQTARAGEHGRFLSAAELDTLRALCDRLIPGQPEDPTPGALQARVPEAIDLLLGAFRIKPPLIHAGGPFSNRAGYRHDNFAHFIELDEQAAFGWRIRLEGSRGIAKREFAGPVLGLQPTVRQGLAHLNRRARASDGVSFTDASIAQREDLLADTRDTQLQTFVSTALSHSLAAMYGPPEYGGNHNLVGWTPIGWAGDVQPRGFTRAQVTEPDPPGVVVRPTGPGLADRDLSRALAALHGRPFHGRRRGSGDGA